MLIVICIDCISHIFTIQNYLCIILASARYIPSPFIRPWTTARHDERMSLEEAKYFEDNIRLHTQPQDAGKIIGFL